MKDEDRAMVLMAASRGPFVLIRLSRSYLRLRRAAKLASKRFYQELIESGLPKPEARELADEYGSSLSIRSAIRMAEGSIPFKRR